ncbi:MAG TPA: ATP-binding protein [Desulfatiglandales bacterium]
MNQKNSTSVAYYRSLKRNIVLVVIVVSITPMILVSGLILYLYQNSYRDKTYAYIGEVVQKHKQNIDSFLKERLDDIRFLTRTFTFEELSEESFLQDRLFTFQEEFGPVFVDLGVVNERGIQVAYSGPFKLGRALYSEADWFKKAMSREYYVSDVFLGLRGQPHFIIAVKENWKGQSWILRATIDFVAFNTLVENIRIGLTGFAFIVNKDGEFQTKPLFDVAASKNIYLDLLHQDKAGDKAVHIVERYDAMGRKNILVADSLKEGDWLLVCQQSYSDAFADLKKALRWTILINVLGGLAILTMAFILSGRILKRIARADQEKNKMDEQIVETGKLASIGELAAGIAHEINNPVAIMVEEAGWIGDLLEEEEFKESGNLEEFKRALKQIRTQGKRCKDITYKLLSFARKTDPREQDVQLNELLDELIALSAQRAKYGNITFKTDFQETLPTVMVSQSEMQQVFLNLINNSVDAMEKRGGVIEIKTRLQGNEVVIEVTDNGPGIARANLGRIFDPFFTTKPVGKGTGLGLSICYGIIKKYGGEIEVHSVPEVETTFRVKIPLPKDRPDRTGAQRAGSEN